MTLQPDVRVRSRYPTRTPEGNAAGPSVRVWGGVRHPPSPGINPGEKLAPVARYGIVT